MATSRSLTIQSAMDFASEENITFTEWLDREIALADEHARINQDLPVPPPNPPPEPTSDVPAAAETLAWLDSMFGSDSETEAEEREERAARVYQVRRISRRRRRRNGRGWGYLVEWRPTWESR